MQNQKFKALTVLCLIASIVSSFFLGYYVHSFLYQNEHHGVSSIRYNLYNFYERGGITSFYVSGNLITNIGENETRLRMAVNNTYVYVGWISLGNATVSASLTKLTTEYIRYNATVTTWCYASHSAYNVTADHQFTEGVWINAIGENWSYLADSDNNLYAASYLQEDGGYIQWGSGDWLNSTWINVHSY